MILNCSGCGKWEVKAYVHQCATQSFKMFLDTNRRYELRDIELQMNADERRFTDGIFAFFQAHPLLISSLCTLCVLCGVYLTAKSAKNAKEAR